MSKHWWLIVPVLVLVLSAAAVACSDDEDGGENGGDTPAPAATTGGETPAGPASTVEVNLTEWIVAPDPESVVAGRITFNAHNIGGEAHELMIVKTDLAPDLLPANDDGTFNETGEGADVVDEIEEFASQADQSLTIDLDSGSYALICNVVTAAGVSHYDSGMFAEFAVTP